MTGVLHIPLNGLNAGENRFSWHVGREFFGSFDNSEILDADLEVSAVAVKTSGRLDVDLSLEGSVTVECDRCLDDLTVPVGDFRLLRVRIGNEPAGALESEDGREVVWISGDEDFFDLAQIVYDYACLAVPMHHVHEEGACNPAAMEHLGGSDFVETGGVNSPFAGLGGLLGKN